MLNIMLFYYHTKTTAEKMLNTLIAEDYDHGWKLQHVLTNWIKNWGLISGFNDYWITQTWNITEVLINMKIL